MQIGELKYIEKSVKSFAIFSFVFDGFPRETF